MYHLRTAPSTLYICSTPSMSPRSPQYITGAPANKKMDSWQIVWEQEKGQNMTHLAFHCSKEKAVLRNAPFCIYFTYIGIRESNRNNLPVQYNVMTPLPPPPPQKKKVSIILISN